MNRMSFGDVRQACVPGIAPQAGVQRQALTGRLALFRSHVTFSGSVVSFDNATFSGGQVYFRSATFSGSHMYFDNASFSGGVASFGGATISGSLVSFDGASGAVPSIQ
ncbi:pentapeptide repeat-containing protein [Streptomyces sp. NPDC047525]|uniref:pentapeptide repeat-containing protein n=1 Tax=Streptomyces sp. NPDC047525 TaxID=3155264 RepID=UPI0033DB8BE9